MPAELSDRALISLAEARRYVYRSETDDTRQDILIDAINDVSETIWDEYDREFLPTTVFAREGADGVGNDTTTFTSATAAFVAADEGSLLEIGDGFYRIVTRTNATTVVLDATVATDTALVWRFGEARVFDYDGQGMLDLSPYDLRELDAIQLYTDRDAALQVALGSDNFRLHPTGRDPRTGTYLGALLPRPAQHEPEYGFGWQVTVTGFWGMAAVPGGVKLACKEWVDNIVKNPGQFASNTMNGYTVVPELDLSARRAGMPPAVRHRLERFRRTTHSALQVIRFAHPDSYPPAIPHSLPTV